MTVATALPQEAAPSPQSLRVLQERAAAQRPGWLYYASWAAALAFLGWAWKGAEIRPLDLVRDSGNIATYLSDFFPPDFRDWRIYMGEMLVTLHIAVWGTLLAVLAAVPLGLAASANVAPAWIHQPVRRLMDACRAINEMVFALLFIVAVGLGPFAGVLALFVHTTGTLAMARTSDPHSATAQFFINVVDNAFLDPSFQSFGYTVFGKITSGMDVVQKIRNTPTGDRKSVV
jgi:phosphonate transport system permease protein